MSRQGGGRPRRMQSATNPAASESEPSDRGFGVSLTTSGGSNRTSNMHGNVGGISSRGIDGHQETRRHRSERPTRYLVYLALRRRSRRLAAADFAEIAAARSARSCSSSSRNLISMMGEMTEYSARPVDVPDLVRNTTMRRGPPPNEALSAAKSQVIF